MSLKKIYKPRIISVDALLMAFAMVMTGAFAANAQGPIDGFMKRAKETDFALTYSYENYDQYWFGSELEDRTLEIQSINLFIAHALGRRFNLIASIPYMKTQTEQGLQDAILALKFINKKHEYTHGKLTRLSALGFSFPLGDYDNEVENPLGARTVNFMLRHVVQYQSNQGWFAHLQSGIEFQLVPISRLGIPLVARAGWGGKRIYVDFWWEFFHTFNGGVNQTIGSGEGSQWSRIGGTFYVAINDHIGVFIGAAETLSGKNIGKASRINTGLVLKRF